jgi:hypothetical protein
VKRVAKGGHLYTWRTAITDADLASGPKLVALVIATYLSEQQAVAWPSQKTLAVKTSIGERSVRRHLATLEESGWLRRERRTDKGGHRTTDYLIPEVPAATVAGRPSGQMEPSLAATVADKGSNELGRVSEETLPAKTSRKRDPLWDVFTEELYPAVTANERGRRNAALKQIREALSDPAAGFLIAVRDVNDPSELESLWAGELRARIARYRVRFPGVACTETAIASHWSALAGPNGRPAQPPCPECEMGGGQHAADCRRAVVERVGATVAYEEMPDPDERR